MSVFVPAGAGDVAGLQLWRFTPDSLEPAPVSLDSDFQAEAAYAALHTMEEGDGKQHVFYLWQGAQASEGTREAAEMLAMALGQKLGASVSREDETQGNESSDFKQLFPSLNRTDNPHSKALSKQEGVPSITENGHTEQLTSTAAATPTMNAPASAGSEAAADQGQKAAIVSKPGSIALPVLQDTDTASPATDAVSEQRVCEGMQSVAASLASKSTENVPAGPALDNLTSGTQATTNSHVSAFDSPLAANGPGIRPLPAPAADTEVLPLTPAPTPVQATRPPADAASTPAADLSTGPACAPATPVVLAVAGETGDEQSLATDAQATSGSSRQAMMPAAVRGGFGESVPMARTPVRGVMPSPASGHMRCASAEPESYNPSGDDLLQCGSKGSVLSAAQELAKRVQQHGSQPGPPKSVPAATRPPTFKVLPPAFTGAGSQSLPATPLTKSASNTPRASLSNLPVSDHDKANTVNASQLLRMGSFKLKPLQDFVPYKELIKMRLEDGIDSTRREDYLSDTDFEQVFGFERANWASVPAWKKQLAKKKVQLF